MSADQRRVTVPAETEGIDAAQSVDAGDPDDSISVTVVVRRRPDAHADETGAPDYAGPPRITREEFAAARGASPEDLELVADFAREHGLEVVTSSVERRCVTMRGSLAAVAEAFGTDLAHAEHEGGTYPVRTADVTVPVRLADAVTVVLGLDRRPLLQPRLRTAGVLPLDDPRVVTAHTAPELATIYKFPNWLRGDGQCVGIVQLGGGYRAADLDTYFSSLGLTKPSITDVSVDGAHNSPSGSPTPADDEVYLDIEIVGGMTPAAKMAVYFAPNTVQGEYDVYSTAVHDAVNNPSIISSSWGVAEAGKTRASMTALDKVFADAAALGITVLCAAGDNGSRDNINDGLAHVDFPASSAHVTGCGGVTVTTDGTRITDERAWNDAAAGATGGGISNVFDLPPWQQTAKVPPSVNPGGRVGRGVPDVAGDSDPTTGVKVYLYDKWYAMGGTSAVSPFWAALVARASGAMLKRPGFLNPRFYAPPDASAPERHHGFRDVVKGGNQVQNVAGYTCTTGWDACTGWGTPEGDRVVSSLVDGEVAHVLGSTSDGRLWHTLRYATGKWQPAFGNLNSELSTVLKFNAVSCAWAGELLYVAALSGTDAYHTQRRQDGSWNTMRRLVPTGSPRPSAFADIACAGSGASAHLLALASDRVWDAKLSPTDVLIKFEDVTGNLSGQLKRIASAQVGDVLHVVALKDDGTIWHRLKGPAGWQAKWETLGGTGGATVSALSCGALGATLNVVAVSGGKLWQRARYSDGSWSAWTDVSALESNNPGTFADVSCAGNTATDRLHVVGQTGGGLFHTMRAQAMWQSFLGNVKGEESNNPGSFVRVAVGSAA